MSASANRRANLVNLSSLVNLAGSRERQHTKSGGEWHAGAS